ncbi:hypothetical protein CBOM_04780 [Ceraceosorus bombacis]|uniref:Uncharacterized protein n=1 Tax=Ceraceosorus bombacis TaxID=401625 RepID=A0A0P1BQK3_9BASI|nr:hypothetical protein CBOM_04780 [Ceraceosorus bombacis]
MTTPAILPTELRTHIYRLHIDALQRSRHANITANLWSLSLVERAALTLVVRRLLHCPVLGGANQVRAFARCISRHPHTKQQARMSTKRLLVRGLRARTRTHLYDAGDVASALSRDSAFALLVALPMLLQLESLAIAFPPRLLCPAKTHKDDSRFVSVRARLQELVCEGSTFGRDPLGTLFCPLSTTSDPKQTSHWPALTQLQLHGPRLHLSQEALHNIALLPKLEQLCLSIPPGPGYRARMPEFLQPLMASVSLRRLLVISHNLERYVGHRSRVEPMLRHLFRPAHLVDDARALTITLVTVDMPKQHKDMNTSLIASWLFARAEAGAHWHFGRSTSLPPGVERDFSFATIGAQLARACEEVDAAWGAKTCVEEWTVEGQQHSQDVSEMGAQPLLRADVAPDLAALLLQDEDIGNEWSSDSESSE